jgi:hemolysin activation/secretion protein
MNLILRFFLLLLLIPVPAIAQVTPNAGSMLQQVQPASPPVPSSNGTGLVIERPASGNLPPTNPFEVELLQISGNTVFDTQVLHQLVADAEGKTITLANLDELAARITDYYHTHDYSLARAYIPAQTIQEGIVRIEIIEARYGKIELQNHSKVKDSLLNEMLGGLQSGQFIVQKKMDHTLLLLSDVAGMGVGATLKPGETVGAADLVVDTSATPSVSGNLAIDNYGNRYTGRERLGATVNFINPLQHGDLLSLAGLSSGSGTNYARLSYDRLMNGLGSHLGVSYSSLYYVLGDSLASLNGHGTARVASLWAKHPLVRSRDNNVNGQLQFDQMILRDHIDLTGIKTDRHLATWTASLTGDARVSLLSASAMHSWSFSWMTGKLGFDNDTAQNNDASTMNSQGIFFKWNSSFSRLQNLGQQNQLYLNISVQAANTNLDSSEKMSVGGPYSVRAYNMGAVSGDNGAIVNAELRRNIGEFWQGQAQALIFVDSAEVLLNRNLWPSATGGNTAQLNGLGVGLNWSGVNHWNAKIFVAGPFGAVPVQVGQTASIRTWLEINRVF